MEIERKLFGFFLLMNSVDKGTKVPEAYCKNSSETIITFLQEIHQAVTKTYTFVKTTGGHKHRRDECLSSKKFRRNLLREHVNYIMTHYSHYVTSS